MAVVNKRNILKPGNKRSKYSESKKPELAIEVDKTDIVDLKEIEIIPSRIVEKMPDGMFRIRGQQFLTIKKRPYKVIATAIVRAEDFNEGNISSAKLIEPQYDVIHIKRTE